jgi:hypothetical protein
MFVGAASSRDSSFKASPFRGWKPLPQKDDLKLKGLRGYWWAADRIVQPSFTSGSDAQQNLIHSATDHGQLTTDTSLQRFP